MAPSHRHLRIRGTVVLALPLAFLAIGGFAPGARASDGAWSLIHGPLDAPAGVYHSAVYDAAHRRMLTFGYMNGAVYEMPLDGPPQWHLLPCEGIAPRSWGEGSAVLDPVRQRVLWFGGKCDASYACAAPGVHVLSLSGTPTWSTLTVTGAEPPGRFGHVAVYDAANDRIIVYGGQNVAREWIGDVWALSLAGAPAWTEITPAGPGPGARQEMAAIYDPVRQRMLVHGGWNFTRDPSQPTGGITTVYDDVWALSLAGTPSWTPVVAAGPTPPGRFYQSAAYDAGDDRMLICAGFTGWGVGGGSLADAWALSLAGTPTWSTIAVGDVPGPTFGQAAIFDPALDRLIVQGGYSVEGRVEQLALAVAPAWGPLPAPEPVLYPGRVGRNLAFFDARRHRLLVIPATYGLIGDIWAWSASDGWSTITPAGTPPPLSAGSSGMAYDEARDRLVFLAGGSRAYRGDLLNVVAALDLAGTPTWITLSVSGTAPPGRYDPCVGYDPVRDRLIVFGGGYTTGPSGNTSTREDTWALSLADLTWTPIAAEPVVTFRRANAPMVYDAARDAMVIFGGGDAEAYSESPVFDAWTLPLGAASPIWTSLGPPAPVDWDGLPGPFTGMVDLAHDRLLALSLGDHATYAMPLAGPAVWSRLAIAGEAPPPRNQESLVFDPDAHRVLLYGGQDGVSRGDLWSLSFDSVTAVELSLVNADATPDQVALAWRTNLGAASFAVERRRGGTLDWERLGEASPDGDGLVRFVDRDVTPGGQYDYRLSYTDGGAEVTGGGVSVTVPRAPTFALAITGPNPSTRDLPVVLSLPDARPATLEVLDVSGRRLLARDVGALGAGRHALNLGEARCFSPGLYLVRLRRGADVRVARVAIVE